MREFGANIMIDGDNAFCAEVARVLSVLLGTLTGNAVIKEIWNCAGRRLRIVPWTQAQANADATGTHWRNATQGLEPLRGSNGAPVGNQLGTGTGSDSVVRYSTTTWRSDCSFQLASGQRGNLGPTVAAGRDQAEVLLHELCHAVRYMRGAMRGRAIRNPQGANTALPTVLDNEEELWAITVANIYCSERGRVLRAGHGQQGPGSDGSLAATEFWREPTIYAVMQSFMTALPNLTAQLATVQTAYNPFRAIRDGTRPYMRMRNWDGHTVDPYSRNR